jgi:predicted transcriptional regulator
MAKVTVADAARLVKKTRATIYNHLKSGELSSEQDESNNTVIDTSELIRKYGELELTLDDLQADKVKESSNQTEVESLRSKMVALESKLDAAEKTISHKDELLEVKNEMIEGKSLELDRVWSKLDLLAAPVNSDKEDKPMGFWKTLFQKVAN